MSLMSLIHFLNALQNPNCVLNTLDLSNNTLELDVSQKDDLSKLMSKIVNKSSSNLSIKHVEAWKQPKPYYSSISYQHKEEEDQDDDFDGGSVKLMSVTDARNKKGQNLIRPGLKTNQSSGSFKGVGGKRDNKVSDGVLMRKLLAQNPEKSTTMKKHTIRNSQSFKGQQGSFSNIQSLDLPQVYSGSSHNIDSGRIIRTVSYTHLTLPTTPYV